MSTYDIERCIGGALGLGLLLWLGFVAWICWRDERRARWLQDEADADEFVRSLREHPAGKTVLLRSSATDSRCAVLERRAAWLRRRITERPGGASFDQRELDALEWVLTIVRTHYAARP